MKSILCLILYCGIAVSQEHSSGTKDAIKSTANSSSVQASTATTCYEIPFPEGTLDQKENTIELTIVNNSQLTADGITVALTNSPSWLKFDSKEYMLSKLSAKKEETALFTFSIDKFADVNKEEKLVFKISDKSEQVWEKEIRVKIVAPLTYKLLQNYPNPFNPSTVIQYMVPELGKRFFVTLKVYDILGNEVVALVNETKGAGMYEVLFDASTLSSGVYFCRLHAGLKVESIKMMLAK